MLKSIQINELATEEIWNYSVKDDIETGFGNECQQQEATETEQQTNAE